MTRNLVALSLPGDSQMDSIRLPVGLRCADYPCNFATSRGPVPIYERDGAHCIVCPYCQREQDLVQRPVTSGGEPA